MEKPELLKLSLESTLDYSDRLEKYVIVLDRKEEAKELRDYVAALEKELAEKDSAAKKYFNLAQKFEQIIMEAKEENEALKAALREACGWNWLSHAEAVEDGNQDGQIPFTVQEQIKKALE